MESELVGLTSRLVNEALPGLMEKIQALDTRLSRLEDRLDFYEQERRTRPKDTDTNDVSEKPTASRIRNGSESHVSVGSSNSDDVYASLEQLRQKGISYCPIGKRIDEMDVVTRKFVRSIFEQLDSKELLNLQDDTKLDQRTILEVYDILPTRYKNEVCSQTPTEMNPFLSLDRPLLVNNDKGKYFQVLIDSLNEPVEVDDNCSYYINLNRAQTIMDAVFTIFQAVYVVKDIDTSGSQFIRFQTRYDLSGRLLHNNSLRDPLDMHTFISNTILKQAFRVRVLEIPKILKSDSVYICNPERGHFLEKSLSSNEIRLQGLKAGKHTFQSTLTLLTRWQSLIPEKGNYLLVPRSNSLLIDLCEQMINDYHIKFPSSDNEFPKSKSNDIFKTINSLIYLKYSEFVDDKRLLEHIHTEIQRFEQTNQESSESLQLVTVLKEWIEFQKPNPIDWFHIHYFTSQMTTHIASGFLFKFIGDFLLACVNRSLKSVIPACTFDLFLSATRIIVRILTIRDSPKETFEAFRALYGVFNTEIAYLIRYDQMFLNYKEWYESGTSIDGCQSGNYHVPINLVSFGKTVEHIFNANPNLQQDFLVDLENYKHGHFSGPDVSFNDGIIWGNSEHFFTLDRYCRLWWRRWDDFQNNPSFFIFVLNKEDIDRITKSVNDHNKDIFSLCKYSEFRRLNYLPILALILLDQLYRDHFQDQWHFDTIKECIFVITINVVLNPHFKQDLVASLIGYFEQEFSTDPGGDALLIRILGTLLMNYEHLLIGYTNLLFNTDKRVFPAPTGRHLGLQ